MRCISSETIQTYIDGEASPKQVQIIERHLAGCPECTAQVDDQRNLARGIKNAVHLLNDDRIQIPLIALHGRPEKKRRVMVADKRFFYYVSAACMLLFLVMITSREESVNQERITIVSDSDWEVDANRPISQQELILKVADGRGNTTEYVIR